MIFKLIICNDKKLWNNFVKISPQGNIFCQTPFLDSLAVKYQLFLVKKNQTVHIGAIILKDNKGQILRSPHMFSLYQGVLFSQQYSKLPNHSKVINQLKTVSFLLAELKKKFSLISFCLHPEFKDLRSFQWFHCHEPEKGKFKISLQYTGLIKLKEFSNFKNYLKTIRKVRRYEYRQAIKNKLEIETSDDIDKLDYLHRLTFKRQGIRRSKTASQKLRNITKAALSKGFGELLLCKDNKKRDLSATLFLYDKRGGYYLIGANHPDYRETGSGTLLMLENIHRSFKRGLDWVDVCGINSPNRGDFKTSLNAIPKPYFEVIWRKP